MLYRAKNQVRTEALTTNDEVDTRPPEDADSVILIHAEQIHHDEDDGYQHGYEGQGVEELRGHKKG